MGSSDHIMSLNFYCTSSHRVVALRYLNYVVVNEVFIFCQAIRHEAFTHMDGQKEYVQIDQNDMFPYLLVNVGSGVSIIKVTFRLIFVLSLDLC
jgi:pantothenate kinase